MLDVFLKLLGGFATTFGLFVATLIFALPLGLIISLFSLSGNKVVSKITRFIISIIRGTPLMLQLLIIFYGPGLVFGTDFAWKDLTIFGITINSRMVAAVIAFSINYAAYFSEIFRGGIESVPKGQFEAGQVLGLSKTQIFFKVILVQVIKRIVPPMGNEVITLVKDTSLARVIAVIELTDIAFDMRKAAGGGLWPLIAAGLFYFIFNAVVAFILRKIEQKLEYIKV